MRQSYAALDPDDPKLTRLQREALVRDRIARIRLSRANARSDRSATRVHRLGSTPEDRLLTACLALKARQIMRDRHGISLKVGK